MKSVKEELLEAVKKESKKLMEEAVTKRFIHTDSCLVTALCGAVENCITHGLKKRVGGLLPATTESVVVLVKLSKLCAAADTVLRMTTRLSHIHQSKGRFSPDIELSSPEKRKVLGYSGYTHKHMWLRLALHERQLTTIITSLLQNASEFYEPQALLLDPVTGRSLVWLLDGPCSLDFSKMKTPDLVWNDPTAHELVQRHRICSSPAALAGNMDIDLFNNGSMKSEKEQTAGRRLFTEQQNDEFTWVPSFAREHVDSLHQNAGATLLYGKNNVAVSANEVSLLGYLSLHQSGDVLLLKWTPNPMMHNICEDKKSTEKSRYWNKVVTVYFSDIVYIHCHNSGTVGDSIVMICQDGTQLPPLIFPSGGSLLSFLTCLEQGLHPNGRLDPPVLKSDASVAWPKLKETLFPDQSSNQSGPSRDYVFRIQNLAARKIETPDLKQLLSRGNLFNAAWMRTTQRHKLLIPRVHGLNRCGKKATVAKVALNLACEKMKNQIMARAFNGWLASYRHLKTIRTHLASLVLPLTLPQEKPSLQGGLTKQLWDQIKADGMVVQEKEICEYIYFGGIQQVIRKEVWPYLLGHYPFDENADETERWRENNRSAYECVLADCKQIEKHLQEQERDLLALNGFANGESFYPTAEDATLIEPDTDTLNSVQNPDTDSIDTLKSVTSLENETFASVKSDKGESSIIDSIIDKKENLREMVQKASKRGLITWKRLVKKDEQKGRSQSFPAADSPNHHRVDDDIDCLESFQSLHKQFVPVKNFDLELTCRKCSMTIIEASQTDETTSPENVLCFSCSAAQPKDSPTVKYDRGSVVHTDMVLINGEDASLKKTLSVSSAASSHSENYLKDYAMNIHRIDKDVLRCDRNHPYFAYEKNLEKLRNIMLSYVWERLEIGYIQGMCDLCAPLLVVMDDEALVYGCFVKLMERMSANFPHGTKMDSQLSNLSSLIQILDPTLFEVFDNYEDETIFYFAYRWFLLDFKRELLYDDLFLVWETIWSAASVSSDNFSLFVALAIIELYREIVIDNKMDFTDIIKFFNEMAEKHDAQAVLNLARNIAGKLQDLMHPQDR